MSNYTYKLSKNTKSRIDVTLSKMAKEWYKNEITLLSSYIEIPKGVIVTIKKDNSNNFDISRYNQTKDSDSDSDEESIYIFKNPYHPNYFTARIIDFDFDEKIFDSDQCLEFKYWYELFNILSKSNLGAIYLTICIDDYIKFNFF